MIRPTTAEDAAYIADHLGDDEICVSLRGAAEASSLAFEAAMSSPLSWAVLDRDGNPVAMFGADGEKGEPYGSAWMYCTNEARRAARSIVQGTAFAIAISRDWWPELRIEAEPRSERQAKFLERIGFRPRTIDERDGLLYVELVG